MQVGIVEQQRGARRRRLPAPIGGELAQQVHERQERGAAPLLQPVAQRLVLGKLERRRGGEIEQPRAGPERGAVAGGEHLAARRGDRRRDAGEMRVGQGAGAQATIERGRAAGRHLLHRSGRLRLAVQQDEAAHACRGGGLTLCAGIGANAHQRVEPLPLARAARLEVHRQRALQRGEQARDAVVPGGWVHPHPRGPLDRRHGNPGAVSRPATPPRRAAGSG